MLTDALKLPFKADIRAQLEDRVCKRTEDAVQALSSRDYDFTTADLQAEGDPSWCGMPVRWVGGCDIEDSMTDEIGFETVASLSYIQGQQDWVQIEATEEGEEQSASDIEYFLNDVMIEAGLTTQYKYDLLEEGWRHSYGVLVIEWEEKTKTVYEPVYRHKETKRIVAIDDPDANAYPDEYRLIEEGHPEVVSDGIKMRVPNAGDVYLDPPTAQSFAKAARIIERFEYTVDDLLDGVESEEFDEEKVAALIAQGPTGAWQGGYQQQRNDTEDVGGDDEVWVVYRVIGRPPAITEEGYSQIKASERERDYEWLVCRDVVFKFVPCAYNRRPYAKFPFRGRVNRMVGRSGCGMIAPLQQESTSAFRFRIDFRDLYMSSPLLVPDSWYEEFQRFEAFPGANLPYPTQPPSNLGPSAIAPLPYNPAGYTAAMQDVRDIRQQGSSLFSADARGPAHSASMTATQSGQMAAGADEKLDLLLDNFKFGVLETALIILSHYAQFGGSDPITRYIGNRAVSITPEMLQKKYRIVAVGNSENASPVIRLQRNKMLMEAMAQDPILAMNMQRGDMTGAYAIMAKLYRSLGIRNPQTVLGQEPTPPPNADYILQMVMGVAAQFAENGDPGALAIMESVQQLMMQQQGGMGAQMAPPMGMGQGAPPPQQMPMGGQGGQGMPMLPPGQGMNPMSNGHGAMPMPMGAGY